MNVCGTCGIIAPERRTSCEACETAFPSPRMQVAARKDDAYWVAVRCQLRCRACGFESPLNELDADGSVTCAKCGIDQAFAVEEWAPVFQHAHEAGDLAGPDPNGRKHTEGVDIGEANPFKTTGIKHSAASMGGGRAVCSASPGHPLCPRCHVPLEMPLDAAAHKACRGTATCPTCKEATTFDLPKNARAVYPALRMVLAAGNRADQKHVVFQPGAEGQAVVVRCPSCNADLPPLEPKATHVTCKYCQAASFIPARAWSRLGAEPPPPRAWWLLFRGPSPRRINLEKTAREGSRKAERAHKHEEELATRRTAKQQEKAQKEQAKNAAEAEDSRKLEDARAAAIAKERSDFLMGPATIGGLVVIALIAFILVKLLSPAESETKPAHDAKPVPTVAPTSSPNGHATHGGSGH